MTGLLTEIRQGFYGLLQLLLPIVCVGCADPGSSLCAKCAELLDGIHTQSLQGVLPVPVVSRFRYEGIIRRAIIIYKTQGLKVLGNVLARYVQPEIDRLRVGPDGTEVFWLIPPISKKSLQERGFHQVLVLLLRAKIPRDRILVAHYVRQPKDQTSLTVAERKNNMEGIMLIEHDLTGHNVVIFDDIVTTGATVREMFRAATRVGGDVTSAVFVANAEKYAER